MKLKSLLLLSLMLACYPTNTLQASITLPAIIGDNMVLQQGKKVTIWGKADPGEPVTVKFGKQTKRTQAEADGKWLIRLDELKASARPAEMIISGSKTSITLKNILVGEVWLASGQSNMEYSMNNHLHYVRPERGEKEYLSQVFYGEHDSRIRILHVKKDLKQEDLPTEGWQMPDTTSLAAMSAAAYFFARTLLEELDIPIGVIASSWGGTPIENWTPEEAYLSSSVFRKEIENHSLYGTRLGHRFEKMILPMVPYTLKGFLWYQGEPNLTLGDRDIYTEKQKLLVHSWRELWQDETLPFYYAQIAPHTYSQRRKDKIAHTWQALPEFWEAQTRCLEEIPYTGMIVTTDLVDKVSDIHPPYKWMVGERFARLALAHQYGKEDLVYSGPLFRTMVVEGEKAILEFDHIGSGLITSDGKAPNWFQIAGKDGHFQKADAVIQGDKIIVTSQRVKEPVEVRFAWDEVAMPNLCNKEGLPAVPFRTGR